jgi:hypothetical protein
MSPTTDRRPIPPARASSSWPALWFLTALNLALVVALLLISPGVRAIAARPATWEHVPLAAMQLLADRVAEQPHFAQVRGTSERPICQGTDGAEAEALADAFNLMRRTAEGQRLFSLLIEHGICVQVGEIDYNSGYSYIVRSVGGDWSRSYIQIAPRHAAGREPDVLAALLVHEATHVDRYIQGTACTLSRSCTELANGVELEEEIAAHGAEAEWWIAAYGNDGKRFAFGYDSGMNELADAYLEGDDAFADYVRDLRSDFREGSGH